MCEACGDRNRVHGINPSPFIKGSSVVPAGGIGRWIRQRVQEQSFADKILPGEEVLRADAFDQHEEFYVIAPVPGDRDYVAVDDLLLTLDGPRKKIKVKP